MSSRVIHFEINAQDPPRAVEFYKAVFGWQISKRDGLGEYWNVMTGKEGEPGVNGGIMRRTSGAPEAGDPVNAYVCVVGVEDVDLALEKVAANGGILMVPAMAVPGVGWLAYCKDTEENLFGVLENDPDAL
ncbi:MAG: VOC family protein [bacterium]|nr:VOC family protein [bacterium]